MAHATIEAHPSAVLCPACFEDGHDQVLELGTCADCGRLLCGHLLVQARRFVDGRSWMGTVCKSRGGCYRAQEGRAVGERQARWEDGT